MKIVYTRTTTFENSKNIYGNFELCDVRCIVRNICDVRCEVCIIRIFYFILNRLFLDMRTLHIRLKLKMLFETFMMCPQNDKTKLVNSFKTLQNMCNLSDKPYIICLMLQSDVTNQPGILKYQRMNI